jgi:hypothetical protein
MLHLSSVEPLARQFWNWLQKQQAIDETELLLDSTTIEATLFARVTEETENNFLGCRFGKKTTEDRWFYGLRLHVAVTPCGRMRRFRLTGGNRNDGREFPRLVKAKTRKVTVDRGYRSAKPKQGQKIAMTQGFSRNKRQRKLNGKRVVVEQVFKALKKLTLEKGILVKTARSLRSHVLAVLACFSAIQLLNTKKSRSPLSYAAFLL